MSGDALDRELASLAETINLSNPVTYGIKNDWKTMNKFAEDEAKQEGAYAKTLPNHFILTDPNLKHRPKQFNVGNVKHKSGRLNDDGSKSVNVGGNNGAEIQAALVQKPRNTVPMAKRSHMDGILRGIPCDASPVKSTLNESYSYTDEMKDMNRDKNTSFFRKRDAYSEYVEARARFSKMHSVT